MAQSDFGLIGLGVMGQNLSRNVASRKFRVTVYNRTTEVTDKFIAKHGNEFLVGEKDLNAFVESIKKPRKIQLKFSTKP